MLSICSIYKVVTEILTPETPRDDQYRPSHSLLRTSNHTKNMSDPALYTVGWICAIPTESIAASLFLDGEEHERLTYVSTNDNNDYTLGEMAGHNVVIAVLPDGEYGQTSATAVVKDMLSSFPNIRVGFMVGIAGGAPTSKNDIRLGDIVVSSPHDDTGGVLQYDYGKMIQGQGFLQTGFLNQPSTLVRTAVSGLKAQYKKKGNVIETKIKTILDEYTELSEEFGRPDGDKDRLYKADVVHPAEIEGTCGDICGTQPEKLVERRARTLREDKRTIIHYGTIASGSWLMKDAHARDLLAEERGVLCFEMEAAGLMNHLPCLVVRGICDYSDSHKNKDWQGYAAMAAAAYVKDLLTRMVPSRVEAEAKLKEVIDSDLVLTRSQVSQKVDAIGTTTQKVHVDVGELRMQEHRSRMIKWLSPSDPSTNYNKALEQRQEGTGLWFIHGDAFKQWKQHSNSFLWLHGIPGCGKTVLSSTIIEHLKRDTSFGVLLYFYFDFNDTSKQTLDNVLRSLIKQLYQQRPDARQPLDQSWNAHGEGSQRPSTSSLQSVLQAMLNMIDKVCIVLDALDESTPRCDILAWLQTLVTNKSAACQLLVTARREEDIESALQTWTHPEDRIAIQQSDVDADIEAYVTHEVHHGEDLKRWQSRPDLQKEIELKLMEKANGMFRWATCQIEALRQCYYQRTLRKALADLPKTLDETYHRILKNIPEENLPDATTILRLLAWSERPLRIGELIDAIAVQPNESPSFCVDNRMPEPRDLLKICSSLVVLVQRPMDVNEKDDGEFYYGDPNTVESDGKEEVSELRLAHFSVKEYLMSHRVVQSFTGHLAEDTARARIATICLTYLRDLDHNLSLKQMKARFQFAQYCARYWTDHARKTDEREEDLQRHILEFFEQRTTAYTTCYSLYDPDQPEERNDQRRSDDVAEPLYYASLGGLVASVARLLDESADANAQGGLDGNALQAASDGGHDKVVQMLLDKGADVNAQGGRFGNALRAASYRGHDKIVQTLLDKGADVNAEGGPFGNALQAASDGGHDKIVQTLLDKGADVNAEGGPFGNALQAASYRGHDKIVQMLLDKGADVNAQGGEYGNALQAASGRDHHKIVQMLLDKGANVNAQGGHFGNALRAASYRGHDKIVQTLLDKGADVNAQGGRFCNAPNAAAFAGHL
ncbi:hypothetical protein D6D28_03175, partial [Aureobasidium pullulans]